MSNTRPIAEYSRQELYDLIWSTPALKLAADFGISSVAVAKRCKRLEIPRPPRGYWAKVEAGRTPKKVPLPPTAEEVFKETAKRRLPKVLSLPEADESLWPLASELMTAITKAGLEHYKRAHLKDVSFPEVIVSKSLAERSAKAFHVLLEELQPLGIQFRKFHGLYDPGYFERRKDRLNMTITENLVRPDGSKLEDMWQWPREKASPSGYLTFSIKADGYYGREIKQWSESAKVPLEEALPQVVAGIREYFLEIQARREQETIEAAKRHAEWLKQMAELDEREAIRLEEEKTRKHAEAIAAAALARKTALLQAAEKWRQSNALQEFINACETGWKNQSPEATQQQIAWLAWAREIAAAMSPFSVGYPNPGRDGSFDAASISIGGPYPLTRSFK
jgi:hypothetical protein